MTRFIDPRLCFREKFLDSSEIYKPVDLGVAFPDYASAASYIPSVLADVAVSPDNTIHQYNRGFVSTSILCKKFHPYFLLHISEDRKLPAVGYDSFFSHFRALIVRAITRSLTLQPWVSKRQELAVTSAKIEKWGQKGYLPHIISPYPNVRPRG